MSHVTWGANALSSLFVARSFHSLLQFAVVLLGSAMSRNYRANRLLAEGQ